MAHAAERWSRTAHDNGRRQLLDAGRALLMEAAAELALRSLTVRAVTKRAGLSSGAFYHYWETQADYIRELVTSSLDPEGLVDVDPGITAYTAVVHDQFDHETVIDLFERHVVHQASDDEFRVELLAASMPPGSPELASVREVYDHYRVELGALLRQSFGGAPLVDGITYEELAVMVAAIGDGCGIRRRLDPVAGGPDLARRLVIAVFATYVPCDDLTLERACARIDEALRRPARTETTSNPIAG